MANTDIMERDAQDEAGEFLADTERARKELYEAGNKIKTQAEKTCDDLVETVKRHPGKTLGITLAAGFAAGSIAVASSRRRYTASDQIKGLAGSGAEAWEELRSGFEQAACSLKDAVDEAVKKFK